MLFIGDVHGLSDTYFDIINGTDEPTIQVGDMGIGFTDYPESWNPKDKFIRGNHDNPSLCRAHPNYLGEFGLTKEGIFYFSGAISIDKAYRVEGKSWWPDEELSWSQCVSAISLYEKVKPEIVVSHDSPMSSWLPSHHKLDRTRTNQCLAEMLSIHRPSLWVHGHHHIRYKLNYQGCTFVGLPECGTFKA